MTRNIHDGAKLWLRASADTNADNKPDPRRIQNREYVLLRSKEYRNPTNYNDPYLSDHRLQVIRLTDVSVPELRKWRNSDDYDIEEVSGKELWERLIGDRTEDWSDNDE